MKSNPLVTSGGSKNCKGHFNTPSHMHHKIMSPLLSKELQQKYNVYSMPIRKVDEHVRRHDKGQQVGKVVQVYRKKHVIYIERRAV
ncbi:unnamed protein product [Pipistrellus nathusii]|uniref:Ribosomal protein L26 n=1 Tax=Pipistrellus nathusii TaxID=59473 RepID=A0ABN9ZUG3_PIPNA